MASNQPVEHNPQPVADILDEVRFIIEDRAARYGDPLTFWGMLSRKTGKPVGTCILDMMEIKMHRLWVSSTHEAAHDSLVDLVGYAYILSLFAKRPEQKETSNV